MGRHALLIATWQYAGAGLGSLRAPAQDVSQLAQLLGDPDIGCFDEVPILRNEPRHVLEEQVEDFLAVRQPGDTVLLYLSCHGLKDEADRLHFATINTRPDRLDSTAVSARFLHEQIHRCRAKQIVVVLDCCFSGTFAHDVAGSQQVQGRDSYVMTATDRVQYAYENDGFRELYRADEPSRFTNAVIEGLRTGAADADRDGKVTVAELFDYASRQVTDQRPQEFGTPGADRIELAKAYGFGMHHAVGSPFTPSSLGLHTLLPALHADDERGLHDREWQGNGRLIVPLGRIYEPGKGWQAVWNPALSGATGNVAVVGGNWKGKTTALCSLVCALALTHTPDEVQLFCVRDGREGLKQLEPLPHVGMVAACPDAGEVEQLVDGAADLLARRTRLWEDLDVRSLRAFRALPDPRVREADPYGEVFVVIDNWPRFEQAHAELAQRVLWIAQEGRRHSVHLAISVASWQDLRDELRPLFGTWVELALDNPRGSRVTAELASKIPAFGSGYGLISDHRYVHVAAPRLDDAAPVADDDEWVGLDRLVASVRNAWAGPTAPPLEPDESVEEPAEEPPPAEPDLLALLGLGDDPASFDVDAAWAARAAADQLRIPFGVDEHGRPVVLDIKESAQGGMGPHGLLIGATGSGKSELLRTIVLGLAASHPPDALNFVFVDFKGGATFSGLNELPHTSAVVTNLQDDLTLVDRMQDALAGELNRRMELLQSLNYVNRTEYERARVNGARLAPLPSLFVIVDEFNELLTAKPEFIDLFLQIGRIGRSLGVHLLLASQRLEEGKLRGLDTFLSYRFGLRTFSAMESRSVLGVSDAYELPNAPGAGYLKVGTDPLVRFQASYVSGPYGYRQDPDEVGPAVLDVVVNRLRDRGTPAHQVWLPPLGDAPPLDELLPPLVTSGERGLYPEGWGQRGGRLAVPIGLIDNPFYQRRDPYWLGLSGASGHVGIAGAPQSGKSTLVRTMIAALALTHTPREVGFYCLDFGGGTLTSLFGLPHVGGIATRRDADAISRTVAELTALLERREQAFAEHRVDSIATYRRLRREDGIEPDRFPTDVFLVIDGWGTVRSEYEAVEAAATQLASRGAGFGIHVVATCVRWSEFRASIKDLLATKVELRLGDPFDSEFDRKAARNVPIDRPGRGLTLDRLHFLTALPRIDGVSSDHDMAEGTTAMCHSIAEHWTGERVAPVRLLPDALLSDSLPSTDVNRPHLLPIGIDEDALEPVSLDLAEEPHLFVTGQLECGKSNLLELIARGVAERYTPDEARVIIVDYRRSLLDVLAGDDHLIGYAASSDAAKTLMADCAAAIRKRTPGPGVTTDQLRNRSWWRGADLYVIVDDYELVATSSGNPLSPLAELVSQARDVGLHLIIARGFGGVSRAMHDPIVTQMRDSGNPALVMSGTRDEGNIWGVRAVPLPPGRGTLVSRRLGTKLIQTAVLPAPQEE